MQCYLDQKPHAPGAYDPERYEFVQAFVPNSDEKFSLPPNITKAKALNTAEQAILTLGGNTTDVAVLRKIAEPTERDSWHSPIKSPVCWRKQCEMADELNIGERHFRSIEKRLAQFGVLARETAVNGYRGRRSGQKFGSPISCGLSLEPLIANHHALSRVQAAGQEMNEQRMAHVYNISKVKKRTRTLIEGIPDIETREWAEKAYEELMETLPRKSMRILDAAKLDEIYASIVDLDTRIREALAPLNAKPADPPSLEEGTTSPQRADNATEPHASFAESRGHNAEIKQDFSDAPESEDVRHIQQGIDSIDSCNETSSWKSPPAGAGDRNFYDCREKKQGNATDWINPDILKQFHETTLCELASEDAAGYLRTFEDWRDAVPCILRDLGINTSAWLDAAEILGDNVALIALLVIDRNRFHPFHPIKSPGGALRKFTQQAIKGELNLTRSIIGIWNRDRDGIQPRSEQQQEKSPAPESAGQSRTEPSEDFNNPGNTQNTFKSPPAKARARKPAECSERKGGDPIDWITPDILEKLTPETIRQLASEDAARSIDACKNWEDAVPYIVKGLRLSATTYNDAVEIMGKFVTFIAMLVIDRNRLRTLRPISYPAGTLGFWIKMAGSDKDKLNLSQKIIDIWAGEREGTQPRGRQTQEKSPTPQLDTLPNTQPGTTQNTADKKNTADSPPDDNCGRNEPESSINVEKSNEWINTAILEKLNPDIIQKLASENIALYLQACEDWRDALPHILQDLNINHYVWQNAVSVLGEFAAFITLIVIDRNRLQSNTPVANLSANLEACYQQIRRHKLDLTQCIIDIWEGEHQGKMPRTVPDGKTLQ